MSDFDGETLTFDGRTWVPEERLSDLTRERDEWQRAHGLMADLAHDFNGELASDNWAKQRQNLIESNVRLADQIAALRSRVERLERVAEALRAEGYDGHPRMCGRCRGSGHDYPHDVCNLGHVFGEGCDPINAALRDLKWDDAGAPSSQQGKPE